MVGQAEDRRALRRVVAADALEYAGAVVEPVRGDVDLRVRPVDELAVHPDLLGLLHRAQLSFCFDESYGSLCDDVHRPHAREPAEVGRADSHDVRGPSLRPPRRCRGGRARGPSAPCRRSGAGTGATAPGANPVASSTSCAFATRAELASTARATLAGSPRRSPGTSATTGSLVADEDERLHDLAELAADGVGRILRGRRAVGELVDARLDSRFAEEGGHPLDGLRPGPYHARSLPPALSRRTGRGGSACARSTPRTRDSAPRGSAPRPAP